MLRVTMHKESLLDYVQNGCPQHADNFPMFIARLAMYWVTPGLLELLFIIAS